VPKHPPAPRCRAVASASGDWRHQRSRLVIAHGPPHHSAQDVLVRSGALPTVEGKFAYGPTSKDLEDERVVLQLGSGQGCGPWRDVGEAKTDRDGRVRVSLGAALAPGRHPFQLRVAGDGSRAEGWIVVVEPGASAVVFDIDGTLTLSDDELARELVSGAPARAQPGAVDVARALAARGHTLLYLTARPYPLTALTRAWLRREGFVGGALQTADRARQALPGSAARRFKHAALQRWQRDGGVRLVRAYGNADSDVCAYADAGVAPTVTFIVGKHAGSACGAGPPTQPLRNYRAHLATLPQ
jgi:phosphatidate phosphatase PAH1